MPAVVGLGVALAVVVLAWIGTAVVMKMRRERRRAAEARRTAAMSGPAAEGGLDPRAAAVIRDAERVLTLAREEARKIVEEAEARASEIIVAAERRGRLPGPPTPSGASFGNRRSPKACDATWSTWSAACSRTSRAAWASRSRTVIDRACAPAIRPRKPATRLFRPTPEVDVGRSAQAAAV